MRVTGQTSLRAVAILTCLVINAGPAMAETTRGVLKKVCLDDYKAHCASVQRGEGRVKRCMSENAAKLSDSCRAALAELEAKKQAQQVK
jgi:hypothetical protein